MMHLDALTTIIRSYRKSALAALVVSLLLMGGQRLSVPDVEAPSSPQPTLDRLAPSTPVSRAIDSILDDPSSPPVIWGVAVQDIRSGRMLYERNARMNLMPASNMKLFTTAAALDALGSDFTFETNLRFNGSIQDGVMAGDMVIEGSGDPTFGSRRFEHDPFQEWAGQLRSMGVETITGRIIGDSRIFGQFPYAEGWDIAHIATASYAPQAGGLSYRDNMIEVSVRASPRVGIRPLIQADPPGYIHVNIQAETSARRRHNALEIDRVLGTNTYVFEGTVRPGYAGLFRLPIHDPTAFTLHNFIHQLRRAGIRVEAETVDVKDLDRPPNTGNMGIMLVYTSPPLSEIVAIINKRSDNFYAEQLFRTIAWGGTLSGGERRIRSFLERTGVDAASLSIRDGSGLSRKNLVSAASLARVVSYMYREHPERTAFIASLPGGGEPETTMRNRLMTTQVKAKTGSIEFARALSGYTYTRAGLPVSFSIIVNNFSGQAVHMSRKTDEIVQAIATMDLD